jgi:ribose 5-phosphate isomerase B
MTVFLGADHRGFALKEALKTSLRAQGFSVVDKGAVALDPEDDYVDYATTVAKDVVSEHDAKGILVCGSGAGMCVAANKIAGIRSTIGISPEQVTSAVRDDAINVLALSSDFVPQEQTEAMVQTFLKTPFSGLSRHQRRLDKITQLEQ